MPSSDHGDAEGLEERERDGAVARVLVELAPALLAFFAELVDAACRPCAMSCRMMLAETYGMMPSAKIERFASAPPREHVEEAEQAAALLGDDGVITLRSTPGIVTNTPIAVDREHRRA